ncbi:MAG: glycosyltransferase [Chloroflexota bacterium]|nr:glycosyltransferase [Chloroflexota bacterium]
MQTNSPDQPPPRVSVLMPTFKQAPFIRRALESLRAQGFTDWELVIVDDGSPDDTAATVAPYLADRRIRYGRLPRNGGLGAALNHATALARGEYLAYLPSDDLYYPDHLARLVAILDERPEVDLAYDGLRWGYRHYGPTLRGEGAVGREAEALADPPQVRHDSPLPSGNILALVQVLHRRGLPARWAEREEVVSDTLEADFWRALLAAGARFAHSGALGCEWTDHADQRHKIIAGSQGSPSRYRAFYGLGRGAWLNWRPSRGHPVDERARYGRFAVPRALPAPGGLRILLAGSLGFNPERIIALEERGHRLHELSRPGAGSWDAVGPFPWGNIEHIPYDRGWPNRVRAVRPDVIYALLNWEALPLIGEVLDARLDIPLVFHFKEGPFVCLEHGLWPLLQRILRESDGRIFISEENRDWFGLATDGAFDPATTFILDGDLPKIDYMTGDWSPKLSDRDGAIHTVCPGRPLGLDPFEAIAAAGIHVHFYGRQFHHDFPTWARAGLATGFMHLHPTVEPADWTRELSRYDAAWFHVFDSHNGGDLRRAHWDDLNLPARLGTFAAAGLPWILKDNRASRVAVQSLALRHDIGVFFRDPAFTDLAARLRHRPRLAELTANARASRRRFAFDTHADDLIAFFREIIARRRHRAAPAAGPVAAPSVVQPGPGGAGKGR